ncbi:serine/threonine-protein kinase [Williamsia limnetica]|jgi:serine/threonine-protein kinase|uniref:non-specific serine/threonine protein kinase n=1 Tax=Williamsia limnetica TaxID=882452 RepID=A0A318RQF6_WILLI|nr:Stk1 family PASTA domain-containing Ser/Thr kinase [Williamsia limnetica]PYE18666.1 serine/threonine-protein kinase [Williamsia limnetica]
MADPRQVSDRYELGETLGFGGMSEVHLARDLLLHRDVAIKVLRADLARDPTFYLRFRREAQNAAALNHPTIVQVFDTGEATTPEGPLPYIVMEFVDGETLRDVLRAEGHVKPRQAMTWIADVAAALHFSHQNGIVHRDVKPANVMIDKSGAVKVMDFGIARVLADTGNSVTQTAAVIGTAQYLSPEQARGESVDARSDVYSLGCVLFELLTGEPPFTGDSPVAVAYQHVREDPPTPSSVLAGVPAELDSVVLKAMSKNPANRYQSAAEMRSDLMKVLAGGKPSAPMVMSDEDRTALIDTGPRARVARVGPSGSHRRDDDDDSAPPNRTALKVAGFGALALLLIVGVTLLLVRPWASETTPQVSIPQVTEMSADAARAELEKMGFRVNPRDEPSTTVPAGSPTRTTPGEGVRADKGSSVTLYISTGPQRQQVPDLRGRTPEEATKALADLGFGNVRPVDVSSTAESKGKVVGTTPASGSTQPVTALITMQVGTGPRRVTVPDLTGQRESQARTNLDQLRLDVAVVATDSDLPTGTVISSSPEAGLEVDEGSIVQITISRGNMFTMPDLRGQTAAQAQAALVAAGWERSTLTTVPRNVPLGSPDDEKILEQTPAAGGLVRKDGSVSITVGRASLLP